MEQTLDTFKQQQNKTINILNDLRDFLKQGEALGVKIDGSLIHKVMNSIETVQESRLKVALIGGFSEGKTSIAAAWMERIDQSMNINQQESSSEVAIYNISDDLQIIDTPGLFGFKEKICSDTKNVEKYKDITKKYVSEAHLVLYVMNSTNPIKESHGDDLNWLMRDLNLLSRTVFVLSRFDEVADVEDEWEYNENYKIKSDNVIQRLQELLNLTNDEISNLSIVAVAANPFGMGSSYWLENLEKFKKLSYISLLQESTRKKMESNGGILAIATEAKNSIILDVLNKELPVAIIKNESISQEVSKLTDVVNLTENKLKSTEKSIDEIRITLRDFVTRYFTDLILQAQGTDIQTFNQFYEREIGDEGIVISSRLQNEFDIHLQSTNFEIENISIELDQEINHFNDICLGFGKQGIQFVVKSNMINNTSILVARDGIKTAAKFIGVDLGKMLNFKPWGAVTTAKNINAALAFVGIALEAWDSYQQQEKENAIKEATKSIVDNFNGQRKELLGLINSKDFINQFFPQYIALSEEVEDLKLKLYELNQKRNKFDEWRVNGEKILQEFQDT